MAKWAAIFGGVRGDDDNGGIIGLLKDGDIISIDIPNQTINVELPDTELESRRAEWTPRKRRLDYGWMARYQRLATSASTGAVLVPPEDSSN